MPGMVFTGLVGDQWIKEWMKDPNGTIVSWCIDWSVSKRGSETMFGKKMCDGKRDGWEYLDSLRMPMYIIDACSRKKLHSYPVWYDFRSFIEPRSPSMDLPSGPWNLHQECACKNGVFTSSVTLGTSLIPWALVSLSIRWGIMRCLWKAKEKLTAFQVNWHRDIMYVS